MGERQPVENENLNYLRSMSDPTKERTGGDHPNYVDVLRTYSEDKEDEEKKVYPAEERNGVVDFQRFRLNLDERTNQVEKQRKEVETRDTRPSLGEFIRKETESLLP